MAEDKTDKLVQKVSCQTVPAIRRDRDRIRAAASALIERLGLVPPLPLELLKTNASGILTELGLDCCYLPFAVVTLSNELWREKVAAIPFNRRLLLLPQCLKDSRNCTAEIDSLGLLCRHCGRCVIDRFTKKAQDSGYAVLVAEGSPVVTALIESGQVQATIGVSCLSVLEKVFPYMEAGAVPGIAIPLLADGCCDTWFDEDWLFEAVDDYTPASDGFVEMTRLRPAVRSWFEPEMLKMLIDPRTGVTAQLALEWLSQGGKRYRPILTAGVFAALSGTPVDAIQPAIKQACVAVECFHKASLIHDDIEDNDATRYGRPAMHQQHGIPIALNTGDYLVGTGYRLLAELDCPIEAKAALLRVAAQCHQALCLGQGEELWSVAQKQVPSVEKVLGTFSQKTSPAFEAALKIGALLAGGQDTLLEALHRFSLSIGIAYQIRDDLRDAGTSRSDEPLSVLASLRQQHTDKEAAAKAQSLFDEYRTRAIDSLEAITNQSCKAFLRRVITRLFDQSEPMECCDEYLSKPD